MQSEETKSTLKQNEIDANTQLCKAGWITAGFLVFVLLLYFVLNKTGVLILARATYITINIFFPFNILVLLSTLILRRTKFFYHDGFKYLLLGSFLSVYFVLNIIIPKHAVLLWAIPLLLSNHYYKPKMTRNIFFITMGLMLIALYLAMYFGEYDENLLTSGIIKYDEAGQAYLYQPNTLAERYEMLHNLILEGENRYLKVFIYYYLARSISLTLIYAISMGLSKRSYHLLQKEISVTQAKQQIETELNVAHEIQHNALPKELSNIKDVVILADLKPTKEVGGDMYHYIALDESHVAIVIGDVSGKGVPAAMFMMKTITCLNAYTKIGKKPSEILREVNATINKGNDSMMFVTCFLGILDTKTGVLEFCNAGHNKPIIGNNRNFRYLPCAPGFVLGPLDIVPLKDETIQLEKGEYIFLYTDGITEAHNNKQELFGEERLLNAFNKRDFASIIDLNYEVQDSLKNFVKDAPQSDDITYLYMMYQGDETEVYEKIFYAKIEELDHAIDFLNDALRKNHKTQYSAKLSVVMDELFSNIAKYAYPETAKEATIYIRITYNKTKNTIYITFVDRGKRFNPLDVKEDKVAGDVMEINEGGLGLFIVKNTMDSISYNRINHKNILLISKKL